MLIIVWVESFRLRLCVIICRRPRWPLKDEWLAPCTTPGGRYIQLFTLTWHLVDDTFNCSERIYFAVLYYSTSLATHLILVCQTL